MPSTLQQTLINRSRFRHALEDVVAQCFDEHALTEVERWTPALTEGEIKQLVSEVCANRAAELHVGRLNP